MKLRPSFFPLISTFGLVFNLSANAQMSCHQVYQSPSRAEKELPSQRPKLDPNVQADDAKLMVRAEAAWKGKLSDRAKLLAQVHAEMNFLFPGREREIDRILASVKQVVLFPETVKKPIVIDMISFPGEGKTAMVNALARLLGLGARAAQVNVKQDQLAIPLATFRSLSNLPSGVEGPPVSFLIIDEWQKLKKKDDLSDKAPFVDVESSSSTTSDRQVTTINEHLIRNSFVRAIYDIYGNGSERAAPAVKVETHLQTMEQTSSYLRDTRAAFDKVSMQISDRQKIIDSTESAAEAKKKATDEITNLDVTYTQYKKAIEKYVTAFKKQIRAFMKDYANLVGPWAEMEIDKLAEEIQTNPDGFYTSVRDLAENAGEFQKEFKYSQLITFILGNPEKIIAETRQSQLRANPTASQFRAIVGGIEAKKIQVELFDEIFGTDAAGLRQRLNVDQWGIMLPLGSPEWSRFTARQVENIQWSFNRTMKESKLGVTLKVDDSIQSLFLRDAVVPSEGARVFFERSTALTGNLVADLATRMIETPKTKRPTELVWSFDNSTREFVVRGTLKDQVVFEERLAVRRIDNTKPIINLDSYDLKRLLANKAGQVLMGLAMFKTLPSEFRIDLESPDYSMAGLWSSPTKPRQTTSEQFIKLALASVTAENLMSDGYFSPNNTSIEYVHDTLKMMVKDLEVRERQYNYLVLHGNSGEAKKYASMFPKPAGLETNVLDALMKAVEAKRSENGEAAEKAAMEDALRFLHQNIESTLRANTELLSEIMRLMEQRVQEFRDGKISSPSINGADIVLLLEKNKAFYKTKPSFLRWVFNKQAPETGRVLTLDTIRVGENSEGTIHVDDHQFFRQNENLSNRTIWQKMWIRFFKNPYPQRPLEPK